MRVTNIVVQFERKRQPAQYETSGGFVQFSGVIEEGSDENHVDVAARLLGDAKTLILTELGLVQPGQSASATTVAAPANSTIAVATEKATKGKGKAKAEPERQISANPENRVGPEDLPGGAQVTTAAPAVNVDIPEGPAVATPTKAPAVTGPTAKELTAWVGDLVKAGKIDSPTVKAISHSYGAEKIADIDPSKLAEYKTKVEAAVAKFAAASDL